MSTKGTPSELGKWLARLVAGVVAIGFVAGTASAQQSLAEVSRKEEARRKATKSPAKVYTNSDLRGYGGPVIRPPSSAQAGAPAAGETPDAAADASGGNEAAADEAGPKDEKYWRDRLTTAREDLARAEVLRAALESRVNQLTTDFVNRDDPAQKAAIAQDRQKATDELAKMDKELERLKKQVLDIQDEGRKAGVPASWVR
jgi:hypothetical protein